MKKFLKITMPILLVALVLLSSCDLFSMAGVGAQYDSDLRRKERSQVLSTLRRPVNHLKVLG